MVYMMIWWVTVWWDMSIYIARRIVFKYIPTFFGVAEHRAIGINGIYDDMVGYCLVGYVHLHC